MLMSLRPFCYCPMHPACAACFPYTSSTSPYIIFQSTRDGQTSPLQSFAAQGGIAYEL